MYIWEVLFFCTLNHSGDRLPLMRTHEDLSFDMELYVFYGFVVIFYLVEYLGIYEIDYFTRFFFFLEGAVFLKRRKMPKCIMLVIVCYPAHADSRYIQKISSRVLPQVYRGLPEFLRYTRSIFNLDRGYIFMSWQGWIWDICHQMISGQVWRSSLGFFLDLERYEIGGSSWQ